MVLVGGVAGKYLRGLGGQNGRLGHGGHENELLPKPVEVGRS